MNLLFAMMALLPREEDRRAFSKLYLTSRHDLVQTARKILRDDQLAEDVVHEAFLKVIKNFEKIMSMECPKRNKYIVNIVRNQAIDEYRKRNHQEYVSFDEVEFEAVLNSAPEEEQEGMDVLMSCIEELPVKYQDLFRLKYIFEKNNEEIVKVLGVSMETVYKRLQRGKTLLMKALKQKGVDVR